MEPDDQKATTKVDQMQAKGRAEIEGDLALLAPKKTVRDL